MTGILLGSCSDAGAQILDPSNVFMSAYHAPRLDDTAVAQTRENAFTVLTNGVIDRGSVDRIDTWMGDSFAQVFDFVGLEYATPSRFDFIQIELGFQFGDGGDWQETPEVYILKDRTLVGDTVEPQLSPNWVQLPSAGVVETAGHVFDPIVVPGSPAEGEGTIRFDLTGIPAEDRVGWGWAVGGVSGNAHDGGLFNFISLTEAWAEGETVTQFPTVPPLSPTPVPSNVVANTYNSTRRNGDFLFEGWRGQAFAAVTNGILDRELDTIPSDGFDTWQNDAAGVLTDFVGLQYRGLYRFDSLTVELGNQFGDGGDWQETPRIFILRNPVDTNNARPEEDPTNWREVFGAVETTGHVFDPIVVPGPGGTIHFDLSAIPEDERTGFGWAVGGVVGNANEDGVFNFISVTELEATGALVPGPTNLQLEVRSDGEVRIANNTPLDINFDIYQITSPSGALSLGGWNSLGDGTANPGTHDPAQFPVGDGTGNGWEELGNLDSTIVAEAFLEGSSELASGQHVSLGNLFAGPTEDLAFRYHVGSELFIDGEVVFIPVDGLPGDFNNDGVVDAADYTVWRDGLGIEFDMADYNTWKSNFGNTVPGSGALSAVPEPGAAVLLLGIAVGIGWRRPRF